MKELACRGGCGFCAFSLKRSLRAPMARPATMLWLCIASVASLQFRAPYPKARLRAAATPHAIGLDTLLLLADTRATVTEAVGPEIYGPIFMGGCVRAARYRRGNCRRDPRVGSGSSAPASAARSSPR